MSKGKDEWVLLVTNSDGNDVEAKQLGARGCLVAVNGNLKFLEGARIQQLQRAQFDVVYEGDDSATEYAMYIPTVGVIAILAEGIEFIPGATTKKQPDGSVRIS